MEAKHKNSLNFLKDVPVTLSIELGRRKMLIRDLLKLSEGSIIDFSGELDQSLNIFVNDLLIARGELVLINDALSIRVTEIVNSAQELETLC